MTGRMYNERWGLVAAVFVILGFVFTFLPQFLLGNEGMPRRYFNYPERYWALNVASTAGRLGAGHRLHHRAGLPPGGAQARRRWPGPTRGARAATSG